MERNIRPFSVGDREIYLTMSEEFCNSDAVLHPIPKNNMEHTFDLIMKGTPYAEGFILEHEGCSAGYGLISLTYSNEVGGEVLWIEEVYVKPEYRSQGFGKLFFDYLGERYAGRIKRIRLEVTKTNQRAIDLYQRIGYDELAYLQLYREIEG